MPPARRTHRRYRRRSGPRRNLRASILLAISLVALVVGLKAHEGNSSATERPSLTIARHKSGGTATATSATKSTGTATAVDPTAVDPLTRKAMRAFLSARKGSISMAVRDLVTGQEWLYNPGARDQTASIMKVDILETLLRQSEVANTPLDDDTADTVQGMIENSDNDEATALWNQVGGSSAIAAYNASAGLTATDLNTQGYWGESTTSAADQIRLLDELVAPAGLLNKASQSYQLGLMENIEADQDWGVSAGVPSGVSVALKNGWVPLTSNTDWEVNSIGRVRGDGRYYLIAVLTAHDPGQDYGIDTIQGISPQVWSDLREPTPRSS
jgi:beta-lactamase class A